jgi:hypothetical protein
MNLWGQSKIQNPKSKIQNPNDSVKLLEPFVETRDRELYPEACQ